MATEVGKGFVEIAPDFSKFGSGVSSEFSKQGAAFSDAGKGASSKFSSGFKTGLSGLKTIAIGASAGIAGAFAIGAGLEKIGADFDSAFDKIRITTGATGKVLTGLQDTTKKVFSSVPTSLGDASDAVADLNQKLGATGKPLEGLATQFINLSRVTGTDLKSNISSVTSAFNQFGITAAEGQSTALDTLFKVSQKTGVSVSDLATQMTSAGTVLKQVGLSFSAQASLLGLLGKNGLTVSDVMPAISKSLAVAAKAGKPAFKVFQDTFNAIKNAPNQTKAAGVAMDVFGAKAGPKFAALIRSGKLSYQEFSDSIRGSSETINKAAADTDDWREKLQILKNKALVGLAPVAAKVFGGLTTGIEKAAPAVQKAITSIVSGFKGANDGSFFGKLGAQAAQLVAEFKKDWPQIKAQVISAVTQIRAVVTQIVGDVQTIWRNFHEQIMTVVHATWDRVGAQVKAALLVVKGIVDVITGLIHGDWGKAWDGLKEIVSGVFKGILAELKASLTIIKAVLSAAWEVIKAATAKAWEGVKSAVSSALDAVVAFVKKLPGRYVDALKDLLRLLVQVHVAAWSAVGRALATAFTSIVTFVAGLPRRIVAALGNMLGLLVQKGKDALAGLLNGIVAGYVAVGRYMAGLGAKILGAVGSFAKLLLSKGAELMSGLYNGITGGAKSVFSFMGGLGGAVAGSIGDLSGLLIGAGEDLMRGLITGIGNFARKVATAAINVAKGAVNAVKGFLGINSPSKVFHAIGVGTMEGLANGIAAGTKLPLKSLALTNAQLVGSTGPSRLTTSGSSIASLGDLAAHVQPGSAHAVHLHLDARGAFFADDKQSFTRKLNEIVSSAQRDGAQITFRAA